MEKIISVLRKWRDTYFSEFWYGYDKLSEETHIPIKELKKRMRILATYDVVVKKPTFDLNTGKFNGSGWFLKIR